MSILYTKNYKGVLMDLKQIIVDGVAYFIPKNMSLAIKDGGKLFLSEKDTEVKHCR